MQLLNSWLTGLKAGQAASCQGSTHSELVGALLHHGDISKGSILLQGISQLGNSEQTLQGAVHVASVANVLDACSQQHDRLYQNC